MPFDTIITINIASLGDYDEHGEYTPGASTPYEVWADQTGAGSSDALVSGGGITIVSGRTFLVRWFRELAVAPETFVTVVDDLQQEWYSDGISVSDARNLAGNPDSPQAVIFLASITDVMMGS